MEDLQGYGFYIKCLSNEITKGFDEHFKSRNITKSQMDIVQYVLEHQNQDVSQKDIQDYLHISNPTVTGLLTRLETKGFITRKTCKNDKRLKYIYPTPQAYELCDDILHAIKDLENKMLEGLDKSQQETVLYALHTMLNNLVKEDYTC